MKNEFFLQGFMNGLKHGHLKGRVITGNKANNESSRDGMAAGAALRYEVQKELVNTGKGEAIEQTIAKIAAKAEASEEFLLKLASN